MYFSSTPEFMELLSCKGHFSDFPFPMVSLFPYFFYQSQTYLFFICLFGGFVGMYVYVIVFIIIIVNFILPRCATKSKLIFKSISQYVKEHPCCPLQVFKVFHIHQKRPFINDFFFVIFTIYQSTNSKLLIQKTTFSPGVE